MEVEDRLLDVVGGAAVMVNDHDAAQGFQQGLALHLVGTVGVHHDEQTLGIRRQEGVLAGHEAVGVFGYIPQHGQQGLCRVEFRVNDDIDLLALLAAQAADAGSSAHGVQIGHFVAHDEDPPGLHDQLRQGGGHDAGFDLCAALGGLVAAAEEGKVVTVLDDGLVAAAGQGHFDGQSGKIVILAEVHAVLADADGHGGSNACRVGGTAHGFQQGELVLGHASQILGFKEQQIAVAFQLAQKAAVAVCPLADLGVDLRVETGNDRVGQIVGQFVVVVYQNDGYHWTGTDILITDLQQLRQILQVDHSHDTAGFFRGGKQGAGDMEPAAPIAQLVGTFGFSGSQPIGGEAGQNFKNALGREAVPDAGQLGEGLVVPDQLVLIELDQRHGEGNLAVRGAAHHLIGGLNVFMQRTAAAQVGPLVACQQEQGHNGLADGQVKLLQHQSGDAEQAHDHKVGSHAGLSQLSEFFI